MAKAKQPKARSAFEVDGLANTVKGICQEIRNREVQISPEPGP